MDGGRSARRITVAGKGLTVCGLERLAKTEIVCVSLRLCERPPRARRAALPSARRETPSPRRRGAAAGGHGTRAGHRSRSTAPSMSHVPLAPNVESQSARATAARPTNELPPSLDPSTDHLTTHARRTHAHTHTRRARQQRYDASKHGPTPRRAPTATPQHAKKRTGPNARRECQPCLSPM